MGTDITDWDGVTAVIYTGVGSEGLWVAAGVILCLIALVVGSLHELDAYKKAETDR